MVKYGNGETESKQLLVLNLFVCIGEYFHANITDSFTRTLPMIEMLEQRRVSLYSQC